MEAIRRTILEERKISFRLPPKVRESNNFYIETIEEHAKGLLVTLNVRQPEELLHWVLGWGAGVAVLEPESFRHRVRNELDKT